LNRAGKLSLKRERLSELTADELKHVAGGNNIFTNAVLTGTETYKCPTTPVTHCDFTNSCFTGTTGTN
jgi:hypothetical protein